MWELLKKLGEEPCAIKYHGDGTFRIVTRRYFAKNPEQLFVASEWDEVFQ